MRYSILVAILFSTLLIGAWDGDTVISFATDQYALSVGEPVFLTLSIDHPVGTLVTIPKIEGVWGEFEVRSQSKTKNKHRWSGTETTSAIIEVTLFAPGLYTTPPLSVWVTDKDGIERQLLAPPVTLTVNSVLSDDDLVLRDIKPQVELETLPLIFWLSLGGLLLVAWVGARWYLNHRFSGIRIPGTTQEIIQPPSEAAHTELDRIEHLNLLDKGQIQDHYQLVTDCVRSYLERAFDIPALECTSLEIVQAMTNDEFLHTWVSKYDMFFQESDLLKFARCFPDAIAAAGLIQKARELIEETCATSDSNRTIRTGEGNHNALSV